MPSKQTLYSDRPLALHGQAREDEAAMTNMAAVRGQGAGHRRAGWLLPISRDEFAAFGSNEGGKDGKMGSPMPRTELFRQRRQGQKLLLLPS